jgi:hypothetical protein
LTCVKDSQRERTYAPLDNSLPQEVPMSERLQERLRDPLVAHDVRVSGDFVRVYCDGHHVDRDREQLASEGAKLGCYRRVPVLCADCAGLQTYAEKRRAFCPYDPKPFCSACATHCYAPERREQMREVMRYAGRRVLSHGHPVDGVRHVIAMRRHKAKMARRAARDAARSMEANGERTS